MKAAIALAAAALLAVGTPAAAQQGGTAVATADGVASAVLPCDEPVLAPEDPAGLEVWLCPDGEIGYMFISAWGEALLESDPFSSDFDLTLEAVSASPDTVGLVEGDLDGMRTLRAGRGEADGYGLMRAIEVADDRVVYAIVVAAGPEVAISDSEKARARGFVESLGVRF